MTKTVFIDFDGTLADHGQVPAAHIEAIQEIRANGHRVLLCTGRPKSLVPKLLRDSLFDGLVCAAGGYVEINGHVLIDTRFPADVASRTVALLTEHHTTFILEAPEAVYCLPDAADRVREAFSGKVWSTDPDDESYELKSAVHTADDLSGCSFGKAVVVESSGPTVGELAELIGPAVSAIQISVQGMSGGAGEIYLRGIDKSAGMARVAEYLGTPRSEIVAIGDGYNDVEMVAYAGIGVVVEGAPKALLDHAQFIIPGPAEHGLVDAFDRLGLSSAPVVH